MGQLIFLATEAIGVGGWLYAGFSSTVVLGGTPDARGLGFRFIKSKTDPFPIPVGPRGRLRGLLSALVCIDGMTPSMPLSPGATMKMDEWEALGMLKPHLSENADFDAATPQASDEGIACVKEHIAATYMRTYGQFPGTTDAMQLILFMQAHHLDLDFL